MALDAEEGNAREDIADQFMIGKVKEEQKPDTAQSLYAGYKKEKRKDSRLIILKRILYVGGAFYVAIIGFFLVTAVLHNDFSHMPEVRSMLQLLSPILTTVLGVIIGSSIE